ncbi:nicotinate mononucleotide-dependent phosphoribosyltransferase CobT [Methanocaldococcus indicus]|uniref:nicotinate mononucleotide-dependent phosphoribosyltransferase CobT n=1 Tax=Methanocaldococcus indicus TaxID=213231 RepID=UPI003C6D1962
MILKFNDSNFLEDFQNPLFILTLSSIETTLYYPISGVHKDIIRYTPALDAELVFYGEVKTLKKIPFDSSFSPTPAIISRVCIELKNIKSLVVDAGSFVKPKLPYIDMDEKPTGRIEKGEAIEDSEELFYKSYLLGKNLNCESLILGECVPGGTTTALGVLLGLGYNAEGKVSSGSINNPHDLKLKIVNEGLKKIKGGDVFSVLNAVGDKMMPVVAGLSISFSEENKKVMLAGGTQMAAVLSVIKEIDKKALKNICLATTEFVINDKNSDLLGLVNEIGKIPVYGAKLYFEESKIEGLKNYCYGSVKEGVGAGGLAVYCISKGISGRVIKEKVEEKLLRNCL